MDEILHTPREESSAIRPPLAQLRDRWEAGTAALAQRVEPLRRRLDAATAGGRRLINPLHFLAAAVVIGVAAVVGTVYTPSYVVEVDGLGPGDWLWAEAQQRERLAIPSAFEKFTAELKEGE